VWELGKRDRRILLKGVVIWKMVLRFPTINNVTISAGESLCASVGKGL
jgi:hypothetical protein